MSRIEAVIGLLGALAFLLASLPHIVTWLNRRAEAQRTDAATDRDTVTTDSHGYCC